MLFSSIFVRRRLAAALAVLGVLAAGLPARGDVIFVTNYYTGTIGEYDAATGAVVKSTFASGLNGPQDVAVAGSNLLVSTTGNARIAALDLTTGALVTNSFITGNSEGLAVSGSDLFVTDAPPGYVYEYNSATGAKIGVIYFEEASGSYPEFDTVANGTLYVTNEDNGTIQTFDATSATAGWSASGLTTPYGIVVSGSNLFVAEAGSANKVAEYDATTGALINASFITGLNAPEGLAVDGSNLYVVNYGNGGMGTGSIGVYNVATGAAINAAFITGLSGPLGLTIAAISPTLPPTITTQPAGQTVNAGSNVLLTVTASGDPTLSYQWNFNGAPIGGATNPTLYLSNVTAAADDGNYTVHVTGGDNAEIDSDTATLAVVTAPPSSITQPMSLTVATGSTAVFTVEAGGTNSYQWKFNGTNLTEGGSISGSTGPQLVISNAAAANEGDYACTVTTGGGTVQSNTATLTVTTTSSPGLATSISTRAFVGTGDNILIGGFYIVGSTSRTVLVQGLGPALEPLGVSDFLAHPDLSIHQIQSGHDVTLYSNIGWSTNTGAAEQQVLLAAAAGAFATPVLTQGSADSELLLTLPPGGYSAEVGGADGGTGVALCAIYELP
jgi:hypothetical protein